MESERMVTAKQAGDARLFTGGDTTAPRPPKSWC